MKDIYLFHYALNCLCLEGDKVIFAEDEHRIFDDVQRRLFNDFFRNFWQNIMGVQNPLLITPTNQGNVAEQLRKEGPNSLKPFSIYENYNSLEFLLNSLNARLYGSRLNPRDVFEAILGFKSKAKSYDLCSRVNPSFLPEDYDVVEISGIESAIRKLLRNGRVVVKGEYGQMGMNSKIITNSQDIREFLRKCYSESFISSQEVKRQGLFIVEPFFDHILAPSVCFYIDDENISLKYRHDRKVDNMEYVESYSPSESTSIQRILDFSIQFSRVLQNLGYRGPVDFEFMENAEGDIRFCEINARYPISYYPAEFPIDKKPYRFRKFRLKNPNLSFEFLNRTIGDYWYNTRQKIGIIPLNIPYFLEPQQRFALLFVGNNKAQIEEMYKTASVLQSPK